MGRITSKGQVTIPKEIRERFGLLPGQAVEFAVEDGKVVVHKARDHEHLRSWVGSVDLDADVDEFVDELRGDE